MGDQNTDSEDAERQRRLHVVFLWLEQNHKPFLAYLRPLVTTIADRRGVTSDEAARELLMETVQVAQKIGGERYDPDASDSPRKWLVAIARNIVKRWREQAQLEQKRQVNVTVVFDDSGEAIGDLFERLRTESVRARSADSSALGPLWIEQVLASLTPDQSRIIRLRVIEDLPSEEVAHRLNISPGSERVRLHRALEALRAALRKEDNRALGTSTSAGHENMSEAKAGGRNTR